MNKPKPLSLRIWPEVADVMRKKLAALASSDLSGMAYVSHTCFLFVSRDAQVVARARGLLLKELPESRLI